MTLKQLPLFFSFREIVIGDGFLAGVSMNGRALLEEGEETWISGAAPVGFAGGGLDRTAAFVEFRRAWVEVLFDIANETASFDEFKQKCDEFLDSSVEALTKEWEAALEDVRRKNYVDPSLRSLPADDQPLTFEVVKLTARKGGSKQNAVEAGLQAAA